MVIDRYKGARGQWLFPVFKVNLGNSKSILLLSLGYGIWDDGFSLILSCSFQNFCHHHLLFSQYERMKYSFLSTPVVSPGTFSAVINNKYRSNQSKWGPVLSQAGGLQVQLGLGFWS